MKFEIKHKLTGMVLFSLETDSMKLCVEAAIKNRIDLRGSDLSGSNLSCSNLRGSDLRGSDLSGSDLSGSDLSGSDLSGSDLRGSDLRYSNLRGSDLRGSDLRYSNLRGSNLRGSDLRYSNLRGSDLRGSDLRYSNLSGSKGLLSSIEYIKANFKKTKQGIIVYKTFGENYTNDKWIIKPKSIIEEVVNTLQTIECASGVNVGTLDWVKKNTVNQIWQCLIKWEWMCGVCVPYITDGKIRAEKVQLIKKINR